MRKKPTLYSNIAHFAKLNLNQKIPFPVNNKASSQRIIKIINTLKYLIKHAGGSLQYIMFLSYKAK